MSGSFQSGQVVSATTGSWTGSAPIQYAFQWQGCDGYSATVLSRSPAGYWRFGEGAGAAKALDASGNAAEGNYASGVNFAQPGPLAGDPDTAVSLDGSSGFAEVPDQSALEPASAFTLEVWIKTTDTDGTIISKPFMIGEKLSYGLGVAAGKAAVKVDTTTGSFSAVSTAAVNDGNWHLLDATFSISDHALKLYVDAGAPVTNATTGTLQYSSLPLELGRFDATYGNYLAGSVDEAVVYGTALTTTQVGVNRSAALDPPLATSCVPIAGATSASYALTDADVGKRVAVKVTATDSTGAGVSYSASHLVFAASGTPASAPVNTFAPAVWGSTGVGQTLTADAGAWTGTDPITYTYKWWRCDTAGANCALIDGATFQTYTLVTADAGQKIKVTVTASNSGGANSADSPLTAAISSGAVPPLNLVAPTIDGVARLNRTLSANAGSWSGDEPISYAYQWQRGSSYAQQVLTDAPTDYWRLDDTSSTAVNYGSAPHAGLFCCGGGLVQGQPGALAGDADLAATYGNSARTVAGSILFGTGQFTMEGWFKTAWSSGGPNVIVAESIGSCGAGAPCPYPMVVLSTTGTWNIPSGSATPGKAQAQICDVGNICTTLTSANSYNNNAWHQIALTRSAGTYVLYVDGAAVVTKTAGPTGAVTNTSMSTDIGGAWGGWYGFTGSLDEISFYGTALSATRIAAHTTAARAQPVWSDTGATADTYVPVTADRGALLRANVTASNAGGAASAVSAATDAVMPGVGPTNAIPPSISGAFSVGSSLTAAVGTWSGSAPISYSYQWQRCGSYKGAVKADTPKGYWRLGEASGSKLGDASGNNLVGSYFGGVTLGQADGLAGDPDTAAVLNGANAYAEVADAVALRPAAFTLEAWVKTTDASGQIATKPYTAGTKQSYGFGLAAGKAVVTVDTTGGSYSATSTAVVNDDKWHLIDATFTAGSVSIVVDNGAAVTAPTTGTLQYSALPLEIGRFDATAGQYLSGSIDEVALYPAVLGTPRFSAHYSAATDAYGAAPCLDIVGATDFSYTPGTADADTKIRLSVTASNPDGFSAPVSSSSTVVTGDVPVNLDPPTITGTFAVGQTLSAATGTWTGSSIGYSYQWQRTATYPREVLADGPAGYWRLGELSGTSAADAVTTGPAGTYLGGYTLGQSSALATSDDPDSAATLDGTSGYVKLASPVQFGAGDTTIEGWFKTTKSGADQDIFRSGANGAATVRTKLRVNTTNQLAFTVEDGTKTASVQSPAVVNDGLWHHGVGTRAGSVFTLYLDGVQVAQTTLTGVGSTDSTGQITTIGATNQPAEFFSGSLDDVAAYTTALSPLRITAHFQAGSALIDIPAATGASYTAGSSDGGARLRVRVTATNAAGSTAAYSASSLVQSNAPVNLVLPAITGSAQQGEQLVASDGTWGGPGPITYAYQWQRASSYQQSVLANAPLDYWRLGETSGTTFADLGSAAHNAGAYSSGGGVGGTEGRPGALIGDPDTAVEFSPGNGYVAASGVTSLPTNFTLEAWFKTTSAGALNPIVSMSHYNHCADGSTGACAYPIVLLTTNQSGQIKGSVCDTSNSCANISSSATFTNGAWHQAALTRSGTGFTWKLYLDGAYVGSATGAVGTLTDAYSLFAIGSVHNDNTTYTGSVDEVALYSSVLDATAPSGALLQHYQAATVAPSYGAISGATSATYAPISADVGSNLRVEVTATNASGSTAADSLGTGSVTGPGIPMNPVRPKISGTVAVGNDLVADDGSWTGKTPMTFTRQWRRITSSYANTVLQDGPVGYWRFDEQADATTLADASGNGNKGTYTGQINFNQPAGIRDEDSSITLGSPSGSYATVPNSTALQTTKFTVEAWVRALTTSTSQKIIGKGQGPNTNEQYGLWILSTSGYANVDAWIDGVKKSVTGTTRIGDNTWHYVAATYDGTKLTLYVDGAQQGFVSAPGKVSTNTQQISIGKEVSSTTNQYPLTAGMQGLDEVAVYDAALDSTRITAHYNAGRTNPTIADISGATANRYTITSTDTGAALQLKLTATNSAGTSTAYSLQTLPVGGAPLTLALPEDGDTVHMATPVLSVNLLEDQTNVSYGFQVAADAGFTSIVAQSPWLPSTTTWTVPTTANLGDGRSYYWRARALSSGAFTDWSAARSFKVVVKRYGVRSDWPIWSHGAVSVNKASGNLFLSAPTPSFATEVGSLSVSLSYNAQDPKDNNGFGIGWTFSAGATPPTKLIDHFVLQDYDAAEVVWPDGGSDYFDHVGSSNTYRSAPGGHDQLAKNRDGTWTLLTADGTIFTFAKASSSNGVAKLTRAEAVEANASKSSTLFTYDSSDRVTQISESTDPTRALTLNWSCTGAIVCVTGPDNKTWKYLGSASTGVTGVFDGTRTVMQLTYTNHLITKIQNANDLAPANASAGYNGSHSISIDYDANKRVTRVSDGPVSHQSPSTLTWALDYHLSGPYPTTPTRVAHADGAAGTIRQAAGFTILTDPAGNNSTVFFDGSDHPIEEDDELGHVRELGWNGRGQLLWREDALGNSTKNTWDAVNGILLSTQAPDGGRTQHRYDEAAVGTAASPGPVLQGLQGSYYNNVYLAGRPTTRRTDAAVDFDWGTSGPDAGVGTSGYSVTLSGNVVAPADGDYVFSVYTEGGAQLVVDSLQAINAWQNSGVTTLRSQPIHLTPGAHQIQVDYANLGAASHLHLLWACANCASSFGARLIPSASLRPAWNNETSTVTAGGRLSYTHFADPAAGQPDYTLTQPDQSTKLITSYDYDTYGRTLSRVQPRGNAGRTVGADGSLSGAVDRAFLTSYNYYAPGETATPAAPCSGPSADQGGQLKSIVAPLLAMAVMVYDNTGNTVSKQNGAGTTCATFDGEGRLVAQTDADSHTTSYALDPIGNTLRVTSAGGSRTSTIYDELNHPVTETDGRGSTTTHTYDRLGQEIKTTNPVGGTTRSVFEAAGNETASTDELGRTTTFAYDAEGRRISTTTPLDHRSTIIYDGMGRIVAGIDPLDHRHSIAYDADGETVTTTNALGKVSKQTYDLAGRLTSVTDENDQTTSYGYDENGNRTSVTAPDGGITRYAYNAADEKVATTDPLGHSTTFTYDGAGRPVSTTSPAGEVTKIAYDPAGNKISQTDAAANKTTFQYDVLNREIARVSPLGLTTRTSYDANDNITRLTDALGNVTVSTYDAADRLISIADPLGNRRSMTYDLADKLLTEVDERGNTTRYMYDAEGKRVAVTASDGGVTTTTYDAAGRVTAMTRPVGGVDQFTYDDAGHVISQKDALGRIVTHTYDPAGNEVSTTDANGTTTATTFDSANRVTRKTYSGAITPAVSYVYDKAGNRTLMTDGAGTVSYGHDVDNRLTSVTRGSAVFGYAYDARGLLSSRSYPNAAVTTYGYDADGRLVSATHGSQTTGYVYNANGELTRKQFPNGWTEQLSYDATGAITDMRSTKGTSTAGAATYTRDASGNPTRIVRDGVTENYSYDTMNRVTAVCYGASVSACASPQLISYSYDKDGNRTSDNRFGIVTASFYDSGDQLTSSSASGATKSYVYDGNGNEVRAGATSYTYDAEDNLIQAATGSAVTSFSYDGDGDRLTKTAGANTTTYRWDVNNDLPQLALEQGPVTRSYFYGVDMLSMEGGAQSLYYHTDAIGSVVATTNGSGVLAQTYSYDPYGNLRSATNPDPTAPANDMRFAGQLTDPETGLYNMRARTYDPNIGRFLSTDSITNGGSDQGISPYVYAGDNPLENTDPSGEAFIWDETVGGACAGASCEQKVEDGTICSAGQQLVEQEGGFKGCTFVCTSGGTYEPGYGCRTAGSDSAAANPTANTPQQAQKIARICKALLTTLGVCIARNGRFITTKNQLFKYFATLEQGYMDILKDLFKEIQRLKQKQLSKQVRKLNKAGKAIVNTKGGAKYIETGVKNKEFRRFEKKVDRIQAKAANFGRGATLYGIAAKGMNGGTLVLEFASGKSQGFSTPHAGADMAAGLAGGKIAAAAVRCPATRGAGCAVAVVLIGAQVGQAVVDATWECARHPGRCAKDTGEAIADCASHPVNCGRSVAGSAARTAKKAKRTADDAIQSYECSAREMLGAIPCGTPPIA